MKHEARVLQFGTGVFVRGFFDWMLQRAQDNLQWEGSVLGVKLTPDGEFPLSSESAFPHTMRGISNGCQIEQHSTISVVERWINPHQTSGLQELLASAQVPGLDIVVSNSTEAGITYRKEGRPADGTCSRSFPTMLLLWLHARFGFHPSSRVTVLPFELVEDNGQKLKEIILQHADDWCLGPNFRAWLHECCDFRSTLVDRIVTKPSSSEHPLLTIAEPYHLLAIEGDNSLEERLPLLAAGANVLYLDDLSQQRSRKVRVLNGAHHTIAFLGMAMGKGSVLDCMKDDVLNRFLKHVLFQEVLPSLQTDAQDLQELRHYAETILERFANPWLDHRLEAIAMNSAAKVPVRLIPSIVDYLERFGELPHGLILAVAAFLAYDGSTKGCETSQVENSCQAVNGLSRAVEAAMVDLSKLRPTDAILHVLSKAQGSLPTLLPDRIGIQKVLGTCKHPASVPTNDDVLLQSSSPVLPARMRRCVLEEPGRFVISEVDVPSKPEAGWAIIRVGAVGMCGTDYHAFHGRQNFFSYPRVLGHEIGATVVSLGECSGDSPIKVGDRCAVVPYWGCQSCVACRNGKPNCCERISVIGVHAHGAMQQYLAVPVDKLVPSQSLSLEQLALVETLCIGAHAVARGQPKSGENVLVVGAGPIGMAVAQFAQAEGANVAIADINDARLEFTKKSAGISHAINSNEVEDLAHAVSSVFGGELPTLVLDATGNLKSMQGAFGLAGHGGRVVFVGHTKECVCFDNPLFHARELTLGASRNALRDDFVRVIKLIENKHVDVSAWITHHCTLDTFEDNFMEWMMPDSGVIKGIVKME